MRLQIDGGKTVYDGVYATHKYSKLSISKSKVSPIMNDFPVIIDITKGGVIDRSGSLVWWMTELTSPTVFKQSAWWSVEDWCYEKYKPYWDKIGKFYPRFRQSVLYETAEQDENFVDLLQLIWLDLISSRYVLQAQVVKELRSEVETRLMVNLGVTESDFKKEEAPEISTSVSSEDLSSLSDLLGESVQVDQSTGEVLSN